MPLIHHIGFNCRDRIAQEKFYTRHFGFKRARVFNRGKENEFVMLRLGTTCLELFGAASDSQGGEQPIGFKHLAFEVTDIDALRDRLLAEGIKPISPEVLNKDDIIPGLRLFFFRDPEGNILELMQGWKDEA